MALLWCSAGSPNAKALVLCCSCVVGIVAVVVVARRVRRRVAEDDNEDEEIKPQKRFKRILADNTPLPFVHLEIPGKGEDSHPYGDEIRALLEGPVLPLFETEQPLAEMEEPFVWIETKEALEDLAQVLSEESEFAVDTEQHSIRSFLGFTALIQISTYKRDYLIDAIALHDEMETLRPVFANASICKVFHGADSDILWLQRDFHIYVVNLFDTARACDVLGKPQRSLAYLLQTYCNISTNKAFQKSDWRQRPLPEDILLYARSDAHFLLYIARKLYSELLQGETDLANAPLQMATRRSHLICLQLYEKDASSASAAASLFSKFQESNLDKPREASMRRRLRLLCEWRDAVARIEDESLRFVLSDAAIVAIARTLPRTGKEVYRSIHAADMATSTDSSKTSLLPSPSPLVKRHISSLILAIKDSAANATSGEQRDDKKGRRFLFNKRSNSELKRTQFVKKFSCKGLVYENCRIYAGDGRLLCYCDRRKLEWYLQRGLAERLNEEPPAIRLCFEPKGRPEDENNEFYIQSKSNQCVGCGESSHYLRYRIIPSCYRQHFPEYLKSHRSHDIVLLCVDCHEKAHRAAEKYKHVIALESGIPLFARKIIAAEDVEGSGYSVIESETGVPPLQLRNAAMALLCHGPDMPESRRAELEMVISGYFGGRQIDEADMKAAALVGIDPRGKKRLTRKIDKLLRKKQAHNSNAAVESPVVENGEPGKNPKKTHKISLLGHGLHGKKVVEKIWEGQGEDGIRDFIQRWRMVFVDAVHPGYLPTGWEVTHSGRREFGEHSVYRPKWLTRT
ncbi:protein RRP6-like 3 [Selaginella moellendorffii]|uniref:protein RRP6-like 3 n=1 Tax=Selaginella moellendorffii TaxID=88036 RepID=UPI000D1C9DF4|nr:protein RRP6-like 3 [Selaginella moellendorffii]XP_024520049.1 protein RRP6-like 3 [Selaginella moellendorffii]|eukprot:XP_024520048.1 protein RRP6-like 3 [Selaginella moellendorffii]